MKPVIVGEVGSVAHGLGVPESDHDYHGVYIDPPEALIGLNGSKGAFRHRDRPEGVKSEPGDEEATFYALRDYARLAAAGNPTVLTLLFTPTLTVHDSIGLQANRDMFLSKQIATTHVGYATSMFRRLTGDLAPRTNRPQLIEEHGYDTKAAFHAIRHLIQGHELLMFGTMTMPMYPMVCKYLLDVRAGKYTEQDVINAILAWHDKIEHAAETSQLPDRADMGRINEWLVATHEDAWT